MRIGIIPKLVTVAVLLTACGNSDEAVPAATGNVPSTTQVATSAPLPTTAPATTAVLGETDDVDVPETLPVVVVTYSVLAAVVEPILSGVADVRVLIPNGQDPHDYAPSAKDVELMASAVLVVANGLDLEEGLVDTLSRVESDGVPVFRVTDHVTLLELGKDDDGHDHDHGSEDPHVWTDPLTMGQMLPTFSTLASEVLGVDLTEQTVAAAEGLRALDAEVQAVMSTVNDCRLVTGHDSMQYFAQRYGCEVIGAVIPSLSTGAEPSAGELSELRRVAQGAGVAAIFTELGTPTAVAEQIAREVGVPLVELSTHVVPDGGGYRQFMLSMAVDIAEALS